jgi:hypothetical protein
MNQALYAHMNNKRKMKKKKEVVSNLLALVLALSYSQFLGPHSIHLSM